MQKSERDISSRESEDIFIVEKRYQQKNEERQSFISIDDKKVAVTTKSERTSYELSLYSKIEESFFNFQRLKIVF